MTHQIKFEFKLGPFYIGHTAIQSIYKYALMQTHQMSLELVVFLHESSIRKAMKCYLLVFLIQSFSLNCNTTKMKTDVARWVNLIPNVLIFLLKKQIFQHKLDANKPMYYLEHKYIGKSIIRLLIHQMTRKTIIWSLRLFVCILWTTITA